MIRVLQGNMNRCRAAMELLEQTILDNKVDLVIIAEPNKNMAKRGRWISDSESDVAVRTCGRRAKIRQTGTGEGFVWVELDCAVIYGCYISPNVADSRYETFLRALRADIGKHRKEIIVAGDFNAKSRLWGSPVEDRRGDMVADWLAQDDLVVQNRGNIPTFVRGDSISYIDVTFCTPGIASRIVSWKVLVGENLSDHQDITFEICGAETTSGLRESGAGGGWKVNRAALTSLRVEITRQLEQEGGNREHLRTAEGFAGMITRACNNVFPRRRAGERRHPVYWWSDDIAQTRRECLTKKRKLARANGRPVEPGEREKTKTEYRELRKILRNLIKKAKRKAWIDICDEVDANVWGDGYRIACRKFRLHPKIELTEEQRFEEARKLFPENEVVRWPEVYIQPAKVTPFDTAELVQAGARLRDRKAPGPDFIPPEVIKAAIDEQPQYCLEVMNRLLIKGEFPKIWKTARLVLLEKSRQEGQVNVSYRPLCMLNTIGKLMEQMLRVRLNEEIERTGGLADDQYGFREGRSTVDAMTRVQQLADDAERGSYGGREYCVLATLDVQNAFNSAPWKGVVDVLRRRGVAPYLVKMICSYFTDRQLEIGPTKRMDVTCGVPQGSVIGPLLWNIYYDGVLRLPVPRGVTLVGYADDLAVVTTAATREALEDSINHAIFLIEEWMQRARLKLAPHKTEAVVLVGRRKLQEIEFEVEGVNTRTTEVVKYLGVSFARNMRMNQHLLGAAKKAEASAMSITRLMPNVGGARASRRRVLASVVDSVMLYAAPVWVRALKQKSGRGILEKVQRRTALRICSAYRTASTEAVVVLAGVPPLELLAEERCRIYRGEDAKEARRETLERWQRMWEEDTGKAAWTKRLIPDVRQWMGRSHGEVNYHITQMMTGHGCFQAYLKRFHLAETDGCWYCDAVDTVEHTIFRCVRWREQRDTAERMAGGPIAPENIAETMLTSERGWSAIGHLARSILERKEEEERERQRREQQADAEPPNPGNRDGWT